MQQLNLPDFDIRLRTGEVFCLIRKRWILLTPEEWVRQHFLHLLIHHLGYPKGLMRVEQSFRYFKNQKRSDIAVLKKDSGVFLLVECKAPHVKLNKQVLRQISEYNKMVQSDHIAVTNGLHHFVWQKMEGQYHQLKDFPAYL